MKKSKNTLKFLVLVIFALLILNQFCFYSPRYIYRVLAWQHADYDDYKKFKFNTITKSNVAYKFNRGTINQYNEVINNFEKDTLISNLNSFLDEKLTHSFVVIRNDTILYESYHLGNTRESIQTSFSVSKSILSLLIGKAIDDGLIMNVNEPITKYLPELIDEDIRFNDITIFNLLQMKSGIAYSQEASFPFVNADAPKTYYHPDLRIVALKHSKIETNPGENFKYNNYNALLIGLILERVTKMSTSKYFEKKIWKKIGSEFDATWSTDEGNFEKMESGFNARAIDFAKIGKLVLDKGYWGNEKIVSPTWIEKSTNPIKDKEYQSFNNPKYWSYGLFWWITPNKDANSDFMAIGNYGQIIYISPRTNTIILRNGQEAIGFDDDDWINVFKNFLQIN